MRVEDNGSAYLLVLNKGTEQRLVIGSFVSLGQAWEQIQWMYRIETQEYMYENHLPEEIWVAGFYHSGDWDEWTELKTLELREYTALKEGICPICHQALDLYHDKNKCPCCGKEW